MNISARLIDHGKLVLVTFLGEQTTEQAVQDIEDLTRMTEFNPELPRFADLSGITGHVIDFRGMWRLARMISQNTVPSGRTKLVALYAPDDGVYGSARMLSSLSELEAGNIAVEVFRTQAEALAWLGRTETSLEQIDGYAAAEPKPGSCSW